MTSDSVYKEQPLEMSGESLGKGVCDTDEPTSPKKPKSVPEPECSDLEGGAASPLPSEWTSVRISPGEDVAGQDMLAMCVLVTIEDSSSDTESSYSGNEASSTQPHRPQAPPRPKPLSRHISLREASTRAASPPRPEEPKAVPGLMPMNKRAMSPPKEPPPLPLSSLSSASSWSSPSSSSSGSVPDGSSPPQVTASHPSSQVPRGHSSPSTPIFLRRARSQGVPRDIALYLPHDPVLERAEFRLLSSSGDSQAGPAELAPDTCEEAKASLGDTRSTHRDPHSAGGKDRYLLDQKLSPRVEKEPGKGTARPRRAEEVRSEVEEERKAGLKKLVLTGEQKTALLDWSDSLPERMHLRVGEPPSQKSAEHGRGGQVPKPVHPSQCLQMARETPPARREAQDSMGTLVQRAPVEQSVAPPKSPLRLIANAIRRSLEPLLPNSEGNKKAWTKPESKTSPISQPHTCTRSFSLRKSSSNKDWDQRCPGRDTASKATAFFPLGSPAARNAQASGLSPPDTTLRSQSLPNRQSKMSPAFMSPPYSKIEDVPTLLEKVSLQETSPDTSRVPKKSFSLFSSLRLKDRSFESFLQETRQRKDIRDFFGSTKGKVAPENSSQVLGKLMQSFKRPSLDQAPRLPLPPAGSQHIHITEQVTEQVSSASSTTSSSADEESDPPLSLRSQERKTLRRRRKLEKATKQLVKQEELKRLYKAQAIQRQLEEVEERQRASEIQGVQLEKALRGEADSGSQDEAQLLQEWFKLVLEKNKLMRYESELLIMAQELELEDHQSRLEQKLRENMLKDESQKDENDLNEEHEIFTEMMQVIEQRDKLVESLEEQRMKEKAEDQHFESFILSRGCQLSRT